MRLVLASGLLLVIGAAGAGRSSAAPPPLPPPGAIELATKIVDLPAAADLPTYLQLFSDDVTVSEGDKLVASGLGGWATYLRPRLGLHHRTLHISYGNPIMVAETIDNMSYRGPNTVQDCCFWARISLYHLRDDFKVDNVRIIEDGSTWESPDRPE